jgi:hypothetical protein
MFRPAKFVTWALMASFPLLCLAQTPTPLGASQARRKASARRSVRKPPVVQPQPEVAPVPLPPPTPEQLPANPPTVTYDNGQLSITSQNATMGEILNAVRDRTGASIELPPGSAMERVAAQLGPAPPREVLASLLKGSKFDYIMLGSPDNPDGVRRIVLTRRGVAGAASGAQVASTAAPSPGTRSVGAAALPRSRPDYAPPPEPLDEEPESMATLPEEAPAEPPAQPAPGQPTQAAQPGTPVPSQPGTPVPGTPGANPDSANNPQAPAIKTPQELLQQLQEMQSQEQNQQNEEPQRERGKRR